MKWITIAVTACIGLASASPALAQEALAKSSGYLNCHAIETKKVALPFKEVAAKYKGKPDAEAVWRPRFQPGKSILP